MENAIKKLTIERKIPAKNISKHAKAVIRAVFDALCEFCRQHPEFAQAVEQSSKTLTDCCEYCVKGVTSSISDLEVYRRAVDFYFTGAEVSFVMQVTLPGDSVPDESAPEQTVSEPSGMMISLDDLLDF